MLADLPARSGAANHNGGALHFGVDGKLYVGVGDNASSGNRPSLGTLPGQLLRFSDVGSIAIDNPHIATPTGLARALWAPGCATLALSPYGPARAASTSSTAGRTPGRRYTLTWPTPTAAGRPRRGPTT